jgi:hypothetical protein
MAGGNIKEYGPSPSEVEFNPSGRAAQFAAEGAASEASAGRELGNTIGGAIAGLGQPAEDIYNKAVVRPDLNDLALKASTVLAQGTQSWSDFVRTDTGPAATQAARWQQDQLEPMLQGLSDSAKTDKGREYADKVTDSFRQHFTMSNLADSAAMSADRMSADQSATLNNNVTTLQNDPTKWGIVKDSFDLAYETAKAKSGIDPKMVGKLDEQHDAHTGILAAAALMGLAQQHPQQFQEDLQNGVFDKTFGQYLGRSTANGDTLKDSLMKAAGSYLRADHTAQTQADAQRTKASQDKGWNYELGTLDPDTGARKPGLDVGKVVTDITNDPDMRAEDKVNSIKRIISTKAPAKISTEGYQHDLLARVGTDNPPTEQEVRNSINNPSGGPTLTQSDGAFVLRQLQTKVSAPALAKTQEEARAAARGIYNTPSSAAAPDAAAIQKTASYKSWFDNAYQAQVNAGKPPMDLLDPNSKDYLPKQWPGFNAATDGKLFPLTDAETKAQYGGPDPAPGNGVGTMGQNDPADAAEVDRAMRSTGIIDWAKSFFQQNGGPPPKAPPLPTAPDQSHVDALTKGLSLNDTGAALDAAKLGQIEVADGVSMKAVFANPHVPPAGPAAGRQNYALGVFTNAGYSQAQAAGIVGNLIAESGSHLDPTAINPTSGMRGIAQWDTHRDMLFQRMYGHPVTAGTFDEQLQFVAWELNNTEKGAGDALKEATTAQDAASIVERLYERANGEGRHARIANAMSVYARSQGGGLNV